MAAALCLLCACGTPSEQETTTITATVAETIDPNSRYVDYAAFLFDGDTRRLYFAGKTQQGDWDELYAPEDTDAALVCAYQDRLYFYDWLGLAYLELSEEEPQRISWIDFLNPQQGEEQARFGRFALVGDTLLYAWGSRPGGGIFALPMNASSLDKAEEVVPNADFFWQVDAQRDVIYYLYHTLGTRRTNLHVYHLSTKEDIVLIENILDFSAKRDGSILYLRDDGHWTQFQSFLYDPRSGESTLISAEKTNNSGNLWDIAEYHQGKVYFRTENTLYCYDNGTITALYTLENPYKENGYPYMYGFHHISDDAIYISIQGGNNIYLINDQETHPPVLTLRLRNGSTLECDVGEWSVQMLSRSPAIVAA